MNINRAEPVRQQLRRPGRCQQGKGGVERQRSPAHKARPTRAHRKASSRLAGKGTGRTEAEARSGIGGKAGAAVYIDKMSAPVC